MSETTYGQPNLDISQNSAFPLEEQTRDNESPTPGELAIARHALNEYILTSEIKDLGQVQRRTDIASSLMPDGGFALFRDYKVEYPPVIIQSITELLEECNQAFAKLVEANREWQTDYQYCMDDQGKPINYGFQVDMLGLPEVFLEDCREGKFSKQVIKEVLRNGAYEDENSIAMYGLSGGIFAEGDEPSRYRKVTDQMLDGIRKKTGKQIYLLAVTDQKLDAMRKTEFGKYGVDILTDEDVKKISGFDGLMGPEEFEKHLQDNDGKSKVLFFVRASDPTEKQRNPNYIVEHPLLSNDVYRREIKANSITLNIDNPNLAPEDAIKQSINDTKLYMPEMKMAHLISSQSDFLSAGFIAHLLKAKKAIDYQGEKLNPSFKLYLENAGVDPRKVESGEINIRAKPAGGTFGCNGHLTGNIFDGDFRKKLNGEIKKRGAYVLQPEMDTPVIENTSDNVKYKYSHRNFFMYVDGKYVFAGGIQMNIDEEHIEAKRKRIHGSDATVYSEIC
jgi:hypothetical protein